MPNRKYAATSSYRYGFNGKEIDPETMGEGNQYDYGFRIYNPRVGRFLSLDPLQKQYPFLSPYEFASNRTIDGIDLDGLEYFNIVKYGKKSLYGITKFEVSSSDYTKGYLKIRDQAIHNILTSHPRNSESYESDDDSRPEVEMVKKQRNNSKGRWRETQDTKNASKKMSGDIATGVVDFIKWGITTHYDIKYKKEIEYASASIGALNKADVLVRAAYENGTFPSQLKESTLAMTDLTNYITDHTSPSKGGLEYAILIETWGNLLFNNEEAILKKTFDFRNEMVLPKSKTIVTNQSDGIKYTIRWPEKIGNNNSDVIRANKLLNTTPIPAATTVE